ncbi:MAG: TadE/TadG family type IV pilus assembly protein [Bryobacteraceae bacterium]
MQSTEKKRPGLRKLKQRGSEMLEFTLVLLPTLGFMSLILNVGWAVYQKSSLQYAVGQGVRYAVTSQVITGLGQRASIQTVVQANAFGKLNATGGTATGVNGWNGIYVDWYLVNQNTGALTPEDGVTGGNGMQIDGELPLVCVSVQGNPGRLLVPFVKMPGLTSLGAIGTTVVAWDRMEAPAISNGGYVIPQQ